MVLALDRHLDAPACACAKPAHPEQPSDLDRIIKIGCTQLGRGDIVDLTNVVFARGISCSRASLERFNVLPDEACLAVGYNKVLLAGQLFNTAADSVA